MATHRAAEGSPVALIHLPHSTELNVKRSLCDPDPNFRLFVVDGQALDRIPLLCSGGSAHETLGAALEKSDFDKLKATMSVWLGGAGYRALESVMASLAFVASLPKGSGVLFDYLEERTSLVSMADTALDALASRISLSAENVKNLIQPRAVASMLHGLGFRQIADLAKQELPMSDGHLVSAMPAIRLLKNAISITLSEAPLSLVNAGGG